MKLKLTAAFIALVGNSYAATVAFSSVGVNYDGTDDFGVLLSNGTPVAPNTGAAAIGFFTTLSDVQVSDLAAALDFATLFAPGNFTSIVSDDFTGISSAYGANPGFISTSISNYVVNAGNLNKTLYMYITSGPELGLFRTTSVLVADPAQPTPENNYLMSFSNGSPVIGAFGPDYQVPYTGIGAGPTTVNSFQLINPVPEPSAAILGAIGALGLLRRRRI